MHASHNTVYFTEISNYFHVSDIGNNNETNDCWVMLLPNQACGVLCRQTCTVTTG